MSRATARPWNAIRGLRSRPDRAHLDVFRSRVARVTLFQIVRIELNNFCMKRRRDTKQKTRRRLRSRNSIYLARRLFSVEEDLIAIVRSLDVRMSEKEREVHVA